MVNALPSLVRLHARLRLRVHVLVHETLAVLVDVQEVVALRTGLQMDGGAVRLGLLHGPANPHGLLVQIARGNAEGDVQAAVGMPSEGLVARAHLVVVQVVAGGDDHGLRVYLLVTTLPRPRWPPVTGPLPSRSRRAHGVS